MAIVVWCTAPTSSSATRIARALVESKLVACVNIIPGLKSIYEWENKVETADEHLLFIKTKREMYDQVQAKILELHEYSMPEIIGVPIMMGYPPYLNWVNSIDKSNAENSK